jgi:predicted ATPase
LQWSYDLLDTHERCLFRYLSIFVGSFTLEAAEEVCGALRQDDRGAAGSVLDGGDSLLEKSLLHRGEWQSGEPRLAMLETIREYGLECLAASGEMEIVRQAHAIYYQALARKAVSHLHSSEKRRWLDQLEQDKWNCIKPVWRCSRRRETHWVRRGCSVIEGLQPCTRRNIPARVNSWRRAW